MTTDLITTPVRDGGWFNERYKSDIHYSRQVISLLNADFLLAMLVPPALPIGATVDHSVQYF